MKSLLKKHNIGHWGRYMADFIWCWKKGEATFFTRKSSEAQKVMNDGFLVIGKIIKPSILKF